MSLAKRKCRFFKRFGSVFVGIVFVAVFLFAQVSVVSGVVIDLYVNDGSYDVGYGIQFCYTNATGAVTFKAQTAGYVEFVTIYLRYYGSNIVQSGVFGLSLYETEMQGIYAVPDWDNLIETSNDTFTLFRSVGDAKGGTYVGLTFEFNGVNQLALNTNYSVVLRCTGQSGTWSSYPFYGLLWCGVNQYQYPEYSGLSMHYDDGDSAWQSFTASHPVKMYILGEVDPLPTGSPLPSYSAITSAVPTYSWSVPPIGDSTTEGVISAVVSVLIPIVMLVFPAFLLGSVLKGGKWGFIIGLFIGAGLGFIFFPLYVPLWLVFGVFVGVVAFAWGSR